MDTYDCANSYVCTGSTCYDAGKPHRHRYAGSDLSTDQHLYTDAFGTLGLDGQRLAINTGHGERLPGGNEAPRDVHDAERSRDGHGHHASRAEHSAPHGQPERDYGAAGDAGAGRDRDRDTTGRDDPMKKKP